MTGYESPRGLLSLEDFKICLPERVVVYLNERTVTTVPQEAVLTYEFVLSHPGSVLAGLHPSFLPRHSCTSKENVILSKKSSTPITVNGYKSRDTIMKVNTEAVSQDGNR